MRGCDLISNKIYNIFIKLLRSVISETKLETCLEKEEAMLLFKLSKSHDLAHLVGYALDNNNIELPNDVKRDFQNEQFLAVSRYENSNYELSAICECLENAQVPFIVLKGAVIRNLYIEPWLRTSSDIDILVKKQDIDKAINALTSKLEYKKETDGSHEICIFSPSGVNLELHFDLIESEQKISKADKPLTRVWDYVSAVEGKQYQMTMREDMFYYYHIAHAAKHFVNGGCGVRPFIDEHILNAQKNIDYDARQKLLKEGDLVKFEEHFNSLTQTWFGDKEYDATTKAMADYIICAGVYGNVANLVKVGNIRKGGKFKYIMSRIWLPFELLPESANPKSKKWLIPFYQIKRWFRVIFSGRAGRAVREIKVNAKGATKEDSASTEQMLKELGLI